VTVIDITVGDYFLDHRKHAQCDVSVIVGKSSRRDLYCMKRSRSRNNWRTRHVEDMNSTHTKNTTQLVVSCRVVLVEFGLLSSTAAATLKWCSLRLLISVGLYTRNPAHERNWLIVYSGYGWSRVLLISRWIDPKCRRTMSTTTKHGVALLHYRTANRQQTNPLDSVNRTKSTFFFLANMNCMFK